ncbi:MAG TPA: hypothetical protein EYG76_04605 [Methanothermococcus okinawensis]|uniref:Uncharacterized protein n=1 Tax=Methanothermococcus okinawensis TaxID=155863 RepID=A0A832YSX7_9EURY|nr:hypothetical protein [Methanothermococcus okinawensis]
MENEIGQLIDTLCDKELIIRVNLNKTLRLSKFNIGSLELSGEFGISFRNLMEEEPVEETAENEQLNEVSNIEIEENIEKEEKEKNNGKLVVVEQ